MPSGTRLGPYEILEQLATTDDPEPGQARPQLLCKMPDVRPLVLQPRESA